MGSNRIISLSNQVWSEVKNAKLNQPARTNLVCSGFPCPWEYATKEKIGGGQRLAPLEHLSVWVPSRGQILRIRVHPWPRRPSPLFLRSRSSAFLPLIWSLQFHLDSHSHRFIHLTRPPQNKIVLLCFCPFMYYNFAILVLKVPIIQFCSLDITIMQFWSFFCHQFWSREYHDCAISVIKYFNWYNHVTSSHYHF